MNRDITIPREEPLRQEIMVNGVKVNFEVDTGCGLTLMSQREFKKLGKKKSDLGKCKVDLKTYSGHKVKVVGAAKVESGPQRNDPVTTSSSG